METERYKIDADENRKEGETREKRNEIVGLWTIVGRRWTKRKMVRKDER